MNKNHQTTTIPGAFAVAVSLSALVPMIFAQAATSPIFCAAPVPSLPAGCTWITSAGPVGCLPGTMVCQVSTSTTQLTPKFLIGDRVKTTAGLHARREASIFSGSIVVEGVGATGKIVRGPKVGQGHVWWKILFDDSRSGWSVQDYLVKI